MDGNPFFTRQFFVSDCGTDAGAEHLGATAGHRVEPCLPERDQRFTNAHLIDARDVRDLDGGEGLDMDVREIRLERAEHLRVVGEPRFHVQPTDNMKFTCQGAVRRRCFFEHLLEGVAIGAVFFRQSRIRAEDTRLSQRTDVRRVDVLIRREQNVIAVLGDAKLAVNVVTQPEDEAGKRR